MKNLIISGGGSRVYIMIWVFLEYISKKSDLNITDIIRKFDYVSSNSGGSWFIYNLLRGMIDNNCIIDYIIKTGTNKDIHKINNSLSRNNIRWEDYVKSYLNTGNKHKVNIEGIKWTKMSGISSYGSYDDKNIYDIENSKLILPLMEYIEIYKNQIKISINIPNLNIKNTKFYRKNNSEYKEYFENISLKKLKDKIKKKMINDELLGIEGNSAFLGILSCFDNYNKNKNNESCKYIKKFFKYDNFKELFLRKISSLNVNNFSGKIPLKKNTLSCGLNIIDGGYLDNSALVSCIYHNQNKKTIDITSIVSVSEIQQIEILYKDFIEKDFNMDLNCPLNENERKIFDLIIREDRNFYKKNNVSIKIIHIKGKTINNKFYNIKKDIYIKLKIYAISFQNFDDNDLIISKDNIIKYLKAVFSMKYLLKTNPSIINNFF